MLYGCRVQGNFWLLHSQFSGTSTPEKIVNTQIHQTNKVAKRLFL